LNSRTAIKGAVDHAPVVGFEDAPVVLQRNAFHFVQHRHAGVVDPGVEAAEGLARLGRRGFHRLLVGDVRDRVFRPPAAVAQLPDDLPQLVLVAGHEHDLRAPLGGEPRRGEADARAGAGDDDRLLRKGLAAELWKPWTCLAV
jgi:hypothetical protein